MNDQHQQQRPQSAEESTRARDLIDDDDGLPPGDPLPPWAEDEGEEMQASVHFDASPASPAVTAPPQPPPQPIVVDDDGADENAVQRSKALELDVPPDKVCGGCVRVLQNIVYELRRTDLSRSNDGAMRAVELAQALTSRTRVIRALQERLKTSHGAQVWVMLVRCAGVLELIARDLRETTAGHHRPGAQAGKAVALSKQAQSLQQLSVRLKPQQEVATWGQDVIY